MALAGFEAYDLRNPGVELDLDWVVGVRVNRSAAERRAATLGGRRTVKKQWQARWLVQAIRCMDLTTLSGDDTPGTVVRLCHKAMHPVRHDLMRSLGLDSLKVGAVCVYHRFVPTCVRALEGSGIPVAAVSTAFPHGFAPLATRLQEIRESVAAGAREIDVVLDRSLVLTGAWQTLY
ncbi:MAG: deoxyribose-phosphate aldolase, partial [Fimbriimonadaceae bacterium]|nr:deoxyribose-phosphate aldolase [Fimbriimonadaceae bacterium]